MEDNLNEYLEIFVESQERGLAPTSERTSESSLNVPFPVSPFLLGDLTPAPRAKNVTARVAPLRTNYVAAPRAVQASPMMFTTPSGNTAAPYARTPATKAARGLLPSPSPAMGASSPSSPDGTTLPVYNPAPPPPTDTGFPASPSSGGGGITTNYAVAPATCPPCSCPGGISTGSILALIVAAMGAAYLLTDRQK